MGSLRSTIVLLAGLPGIASAATHQVGLGQTFETIESALAQAGNTDVISVHPGTYQEALFISAFGGGITIQAATNNPADVVITTSGDNGAMSVIDVAASNVTLRNLTIDGANSHRGVLLWMSNLTMEGVVIQHGYNLDGYPGAGLDLWASSTATIRSSTFYGNRADRPSGAANYGGNIGVEDGCTLYIEPGTMISYGVAERGGGLWADTNAVVIVDGAQFANNTAIGQYDNDGGAVHVGWYSSLDVSNSEFDYNSAGTDSYSSGGAIFSAADTTSIIGGDFYGNSAFRGGAVAQENGATVLVDTSMFEANTATVGGGLDCYGVGLCDVFDTLFDNNTADFGGAFIGSYTNVWALRNTFCFNNAVTTDGGLGRGGGLYLEGGYFTLSSNVLFENVAIDNGGAAFLSDGTLTSVNNHYIGNVAGGMGGAVRADQLYGYLTTLSTTNDLVAWNTAAILGGGMSAGPLAQSSSAYDWFYLNFPDSGRAIGDLTSFVDFADPMLRNHQPGTCEPLQLMPAVGSPLIDAGNPLILDIDAGPSDIGAFGGNNATPEILSDSDGDGVPLKDDCDDNDPVVGGGTPYFEDLDLDGIGGRQRILCSPPDFPVLIGGDCDDNDPAVGGGTDWWRDDDLDGYGDGDSDALKSCENLGDGWATNADDCDDDDPTINPNTLWYADGDGDGWGSADDYEKRCEGRDGDVSVHGDCDDDNADTFPEADEYCDEVDSDCDGDLEDPDAVDMEKFQVDQDGDGFGDPGMSVIACEPSPGVVKDKSDCDDSDASINPDATEIWYDDIDQNCDGKSDFDQDFDGWDTEGGDCDDGDPTVYPDASETVDGGVDNNCDGVEKSTWMVGGGGCGCTTGSGPAPALWLPVFLLLVARRRLSPGSL